MQDAETQSGFLLALLCNFMLLMTVVIYFTWIIIMVY